MSKITYFTSESVCAGHPDKICDQISDAILDEVLKVDSYGRVAVETLVTKDLVVIAGEVTSKAGFSSKNYEEIARNEIKRLGYVDENSGFSDKAEIIVKIQEQSQEIAAGVDDLGAGDQGMMYGYACNENKHFMPMPITIAHALTQKIDGLRENGTLPYLKPDGKSQVTIKYVDGVPKEATSVVVAVPHEESVELKQVSNDIYEKVVKPVFDEYEIGVNKKDLILNGTGVWHNGGPAYDTGVTGRKIIVDSYGGYAKVGGGAFSGKDPTKVDRSGAYAARFLAKNVVAKGLADKIEVGLSYYIGAKKPVAITIDTFGTAKTSEKAILAFMEGILDTSVEGIITGLNLRKPIYKETAAYGHFGREEFPWEQLI